LAGARKSGALLFLVGARIFSGPYHLKPHVDAVLRYAQIHGVIYC